MRYKICKLVDGNGSITYQIKTKGWLFWRLVYAATGPLGHYEPVDFFTFDDAKKYIEDLKKFKNAFKTKVIECVEV